MAKLSSLFELLFFIFNHLNSILDLKKKIASEHTKKPPNLHTLSPNILYLDYVLVGQAFVRLIVFGVLEQNLVHVRTRVLVQLVAAGEYYEGDFTVTQHRQLVRLLHNAKFALVKGHLGRYIRI